MKWDQAKYNKLRDELAAMERTRASHIDTLAHVLDAALGKEPPTASMAPGTPRALTRAEKIAAIADDLRDALEPFDSDVREAEAPVKIPIPFGVYFDVDRCNFFDSVNGHAVSLEFKNKWMKRAGEFPHSPR